MPNVLILSFEGFSFSARQLYEGLLPKLLSRAIVHESLTIQDALNFVNSGWPSVIMVTDGVIAGTRHGENANNTPYHDAADTEHLLSAVVLATKSGCTTLLLGLYASTVDEMRLNDIFKNYFGLRWESTGTPLVNLETILAHPDQNVIRSTTLSNKPFYPEAVYLGHVSVGQSVYITAYGGHTLAFAAVGKVGLGKLGYIGDLNFGDEAERVILAMCHLDRSALLPPDAQAL